MCNKPFCVIITLLVVIGGINWGLVGLGGFLGMDLNVVKLLLGAWPMVEWIVYLVVGVATLIFGFYALKSGGICVCEVKAPEKPAESAEPMVPPEPSETTEE